MRHLLIYSSSDMLVVVLIVTITFTLYNGFTSNAEHEGYDFHPQFRAGNEVANLNPLSVSNAGETQVPLFAAARTRPQNINHLEFYLNTFVFVISLVAYVVMEVSHESWQIQQIVPPVLMAILSVIYPATSTFRWRTPNTPIAFVDFVVLYMFTGYGVGILIVLACIAAAAELLTSLFLKIRTEEFVINILLMIIFNIFSAFVYLRTYMVSIELLFAEVYPFSNIQKLQYAYLLEIQSVAALEKDYQRSLSQAGKCCLPNSAVPKSAQERASTETTRTEEKHRSTVSEAGKTGETVSQNTASRGVAKLPIVKVANVVENNRTDNPNTNGICCGSANSSKEQFLGFKLDQIPPLKLPFAQSPRCVSSSRRASGRMYSIAFLRPRTPDEYLDHITSPSHRSQLAISRLSMSEDRSHNLQPLRRRRASCNDTSPFAMRIDVSRNLISREQSKDLLRLPRGRAAARAVGASVARSVASQQQQQQLIDLTSRSDTTCNIMSNIDTVQSPPQQPSSLESQELRSMMLGFHSMQSHQATPPDVEVRNYDLSHRKVRFIHSEKSVSLQPESLQSMLSTNPEEFKSISTNRASTMLKPNRSASSTKIFGNELNTQALEHFAKMQAEQARKDFRSYRRLGSLGNPEANAQWRSMLCTFSPALFNKALRTMNVEITYFAKGFLPFQKIPKHVIDFYTHQGNSFQEIDSKQNEGSLANLAAGSLGSDLSGNNSHLFWLFEPQRSRYATSEETQKSNDRILTDKEDTAVEKPNIPSSDDKIRGSVEPLNYRPRCMTEPVMILSDTEHQRDSENSTQLLYRHGPFGYHTQKAHHDNSLLNFNCEESMTIQNQSNKETRQKSTVFLNREAQSLFLINEKRSESSQANLSGKATKNISRSSLRHWSVPSQATTRASKKANFSTFQNANSSSATSSSSSLLSSSDDESNSIASIDYPVVWRREAYKMFRHSKRVIHLKTRSILAKLELWFWIISSMTGFTFLLHFLTTAKFVMDLGSWHSRPIMPKQHITSLSFKNYSYERWFRDWLRGLSSSSLRILSVIQILGTLSNLILLLSLLFWIDQEANSGYISGNDHQSVKRRLIIMIPLFAVLDTALILPQFTLKGSDSVHLINRLGILSSLLRLLYSINIIEMITRIGIENDFANYGIAALNLMIMPLGLLLRCTLPRLYFFLFTISCNTALLLSKKNDQFSMIFLWLRMNLTFVHIGIPIYIMFLRSQEDTRRRLFTLCNLPYLIQLSDISLKSENATNNPYFPPTPSSQQKKIVNEIVYGATNEGINDDVNEGINDDVNEGINKDVNEGINKDVNEGINKDVNDPFNGDVNDPFNGDVNIDINRDVNIDVNDAVSDNISEDANEIFDDGENQDQPMYIKRQEESDINETIKQTSNSQNLILKNKILKSPTIDISKKEIFKLLKSQESNFELSKNCSMWERIEYQIHYNNIRKQSWRHPRAAFVQDLCASHSSLFMESLFQQSLVNKESQKGDYFYNKLKSKKFETSQRLSALQEFQVRQQEKKKKKMRCRDPLTSSSSLNSQRPTPAQSKLYLQSWDFVDKPKSLTTNRTSSNEKKDSSSSLLDETLEFVVKKASRRFSRLGISRIPLDDKSVKLTSEKICKNNLSSQANYRRMSTLSNLLLPKSPKIL